MLKKLLTKSSSLLIFLFICGLCTAYAETPKNLRFETGLAKVSSDIVNQGAVADTDILVNNPKDLTGYPPKYDPAKYNLEPKKTALSLAHGFVTFIIISDIENSLRSSGADEQTIAEIIRTMGPNTFMAQVIQESNMIPNTQSGWFQIDEQPENILHNVEQKEQLEAISYFYCLKGLDRTQVLDGDHFYSSAVMKGYFDAASFLLNNCNWKGEINNDFSTWALNYKNKVKNPEEIKIYNTTHSFNTDLAVMRMLAILYNRGAWYAPALDLLKTQGLISFQDYKGNYTDTGVPSEKFTVPFVYYEPKDFNQRIAWIWGSRYVNQIPEIYTQLIKSEKIYNNEITQADIIDYLNEISKDKGSDKLYSRDIINVGIEKTKQLVTHPYKYDSPEFFQVFYQIVNAMLQKSRENK